MPRLREAARLGVHLVDERAGGVDHVELAAGGVALHLRRDTVGGEDDGRAVGHLVELLDEDGAALLEVADDVLVVDDLLADVDRRARAARARSSTISIARSTPAQNERGPASSTVRGPTARAHSSSAGAARRRLRSARDAVDQRCAGR